MRKQQFWMFAAGIGAVMTAVLTSLLLQQPVKPVVISVQEETAQMSCAGTTLSAPQYALGEHTAAPPIRHVTEAIPPFSTAPDNNLNTAGTADLQDVSGVGAVLADAIIAYREAAGGFTRRSQLLEIPGIGETLAARIMERFYIPDELPEEEPPAPQKETKTAPAEPQEQDDTEPEYLMLDLNTAQKEDLLKLPDMTDELAEKILSLRERLGGYQNVHELLLIEGMKPEYFEYTLKEHFYIE